MDSTDHEAKPDVELEFNWDEYLGVMVRHYQHFSDDTILTFGHWENNPTNPKRPIYRPYLQLTVGEIKKLQANSGM